MSNLAPKVLPLRDDVEGMDVA